MVHTMFGTDNREEVVDSTTQSTRLTSSMLWDKGAITSDVCFAFVHTAAEKRKAKEDEDARKRQGRKDEMASKKQDACILASTLTTGLSCAEDVRKLKAQQLGPILLSRNEKKPKGKAARVEAVLLPSFDTPSAYLDSTVPLCISKQVAPSNQPAASIQ